MERVVGFCTHSLQVKKCRESLGAALFRRGNSEAFEAILVENWGRVVSLPTRKSCY